MIFKKDGYTLRLAEKEDAINYYEHNFNPLDSDIARLTGCKNKFTHDEVINYFLSNLEDEERFDFMIINSEGNIIGESVINEIDSELKCANFRIGFFHSNECGKGIGSWVIRKTLEFAFEELKLHRLSLDVFSFNIRAKKAYEKAGFKVEGILKDAIKDKDEYADDILMAILEDDWELIK